MQSWPLRVYFSKALIQFFVAVLQVSMEVSAQPKHDTLSPLEMRVYLHILIVLRHVQLNL